MPLEFPSNSHSKGLPKKDIPPKDVQKIVTGGVVKRPVSIGKKAKNIFFGGELKEASSYVITRVLIPAMKDMFVDAVRSGIERAVYGDASPRRGGLAANDRYGRAKISYNDVVDRSLRGRPTMLPDQPPRYSTGPRGALGDIILSSREEAEKVGEGLCDLIETYDSASVLDLHEMLGLPHTHVDNKFGWTTPRGIGVTQVREGFLLVLPPLEEL